MLFSLLYRAVVDKFVLPALVLRSGVAQALRLSHYVRLFAPWQGHEH